jgi:hypothetical protein
MTRYRWLEADWPAAIKGLSKRVRQNNFGAEGHSGFLLDRVRDEYLEARYIERFEFQETVSDPFGKEVTLDRLEYRQTAFRATSTWPGLELVDPSRSVQQLLNELVEASDFSVSLSPLSVDVLIWADGVQREFGGLLTISSIQVGGLRLEDGTVAKVVLKGEKDVREACRKLIGDRPHVLEKLQFRIAIGSTSTTVLLANNATAKVEGGDAEAELLVAIRKAIPGP